MNKELVFSIEQGVSAEQVIHLRNLTTCSAETGISD